MQQSFKLLNKKQQRNEWRFWLRSFALSDKQVLSTLTIEPMQLKLLIRDVRVPEYLAN